VIDKAGCATYGGIVAVVVAFLVGSMLEAMGHKRAHEKFRECRTLLTTADSVTVLRTKPECVRWTLPPKEAP
jgi:hypothetical protein